MEKLAVHCKTKKEWTSVIARMKSTGNKFKFLGIAENFGSQYTCLEVESGGEINYSYLDWYKKNDYKIISAAEYLNEGGKDVSEFKVEITRGQEWYTGRVGEIFLVTEDDEIDYRCVNNPNNLIEITDCKRVNQAKTQTTKENNMNKNISDVFDKTKEALLVEKHLGNQIGSNFIDGLILADKKTEVLAEAKRLEKEEAAK